MTCDAKMRPFNPVNDTEVQCELVHTDGKHQGTIRDYAYPGSATTVAWMEDDRRTFRGTWTDCTRTPGCILPGGHLRDCAR